MLFLALLIIAGLSSGSRKAQSQNASSVIGNQEPGEGQTLGAFDAANSSNQAANTSEDVNPVNSGQNSPVGNSQKIISTSSDNSSLNDGTSYDDLKNNLKEYCGKKDFDVKKCRQYLLEARAAGKKDDRFKKLYDKYHYESSDDRVKSNSDPSSTGNSTISGSSSPNQSGVSVQSEEWTLAVDTGNGSATYKISAAPGSVLDLMNALADDKSENFSYHAQSSGFVDEINGLKNQGDMSWMLYACKGSTCKLSSVGADDCQVKDWDKIEWKYLDWTTLDWTTW